jgi:hypothetical protein
MEGGFWGFVPLSSPQLDKANRQANNIPKATVVCFIDASVEDQSSEPIALPFRLNGD